MWGRGKTEAKWRAQFERLGRGRVFYLVQKNAISPKRKQLAAERWLRRQEAGAESRKRWTLAIVIFAAIVGFLGLLATLD